MQEIWRLLKILEEKERNWSFLPKKKPINKIKALSRLSVIGHPSLIIHLISYLREDSREIRIVTVQTIKQLFEKISGKKNYYNTLRYCPITEKDIAFYKNEFDRDHFIVLMKIASQNSNGYIREQALRDLGKLREQNILPFILFRLADWVPNIRVVANEALKGLVASEFHQELINNILLIKWLQIVGRVDLSEVYDFVIKFLVVDCREKTLEVFSTIKDKERRIIATELSKVITSEEEIKLLLSDKHFLIRLLTLNHFEILTENQKQTLLEDRSSLVRHNTLYHFKNSNNFESILKNYLADRSGNIRYLSRFYLKDTAIDFREFYIQNLINHHQEVGSMLGLLEIEAKDCVEYLTQYLSSDKIRLVKPCFYVLSILNPNEVLAFVKANIFTTQTGVKKLIINFIANSRDKELIAFVRNAYQDLNEENKLSILGMFSLIGGYTSLPDLMIGTIDEKEVVRNHAKLCINKWIQKASTLFIEPTGAERDRMVQTFNDVNEYHNENFVFKENPMDRVKFYIR
ncbi:HEAT repeat domain-containing protein [Flammeovirga aprica]|uniref:HEAT repeat domain-containing protein n=1 Tax=Flammeovirga aprica JL-4 TaxID=694437 RepID=A0A7X9RYS0_9BACT|nr:HEAT repeat domain-containing protein [Flammeovirga aprica]NME71094.1 hypothetical protein [Flammeovirga aprica JL-4]